MAKGESEHNSAPPATKGVIIGEKCQRDEISSIMPSKKGKEAIDAKKKGPMPPPKEKKKALPKFKSTPRWWCMLQSPACTWGLMPLSWRPPWWQRSSFKGSSYLPIKWS